MNNVLNLACVLVFRKEPWSSQRPRPRGAKQPLRPQDMQAAATEEHRCRSRTSSSDRAFRADRRSRTAGRERPEAAEEEEKEEDRDRPSQRGLRRSPRHQQQQGRRRLQRSSRSGRREAEGRAVPPAAEVSPEGRGLPGRFRDTGRPPRGVRGCRGRTHRLLVRLI